MPALGHCEPCHEKGSVQPAVMRIDGEAVCRACVRGDHPIPTNPLERLKPEPRLLRQPPILPRYVELGEKMALLGSGAREPAPAVPMPAPLPPPVPVFVRNVNHSPVLAFAPHRMRKYMAWVCAEVEREFALQPGELRIRTHALRISRPRGLAMLQMSVGCGASTPQIGRFFNLHHTTVLHQINANRERLQTDEQLAVHARNIAAAMDRSADARSDSDWFGTQDQRDQQLRQEMGSVAKLVRSVPAGSEQHGVRA